MRFGIPKVSLFQVKIIPVASALPCTCPGKQAHAGPGQLTGTNQIAFLASVQDRHLTDLNFCCGRETGSGTNFPLRAEVLSADFVFKMLK